MTDLLLLCLRPMMWVVVNPRRNWYWIPVALIGFIADILMNNTTIPLFLDKAFFEEWTFSTRLERLCGPDTPPGPEKDFYIQIALKVNRVAGFPHIQAVKDL